MDSVEVLSPTGTMKHEIRSQDLTLRLEILGLRGLHTVPHLKSLDEQKTFQRTMLVHSLPARFPSITSNNNKHHRPFTAPCGPSLLTKSPTLLLFLAIESTARAH